MNLTIDIGNSFVKLGVFNKNRKLFVTRITHLTVDLMSELKDKYGINRIIYSSVQGGDKDYGKMFKSFETSGITIFRLTSESNLPFLIKYLSPDTLGTDRLAGVAAAHNKFSKRNVMVIDAGTAITYDLLTFKGFYEGGNISPGLKMRFKALNNYTVNLPLLDPDYEYDKVGKDTEGAIRSGVQQGLIFEINEYIRNFKNSYKDLEVIITGGDGKFLSEKIDFSVTFAPDLIIEGLNYILNYNV